MARIAAGGTCCAPRPLSHAPCRDGAGAVKGTCPWRRPCRAMRQEKPHSLSYQDMHAHQPSVDDLRSRQVERRRTRVVVEVDGDHRLIGDAEHALQFLLAGADHGRVDLGHRRLALRNELQVDDARRSASARGWRCRRACRSVPAAPDRRPWRRRSWSGSSTARRRGRGADPCAAGRECAGRWCRSGWWS